VQELSCAPPTVPEVKAAVRRTDLDLARELAGAALRATDAAGVRALLDS
jgi:phosphoenolpyruvate-protein kinase (PTS system EI component)